MRMLNFAPSPTKGRFARLGGFRCELTKKGLLSSPIVNVTFGECAYAPYFITLRLLCVANLGSL